ncbi:Deleted in lung and esophageal cancer protein 1 [Globomyces sp. JEL0801]|nr:Deleted in lung and esophageal cancer protein 1 [Globomyces sp. JEL0801]
MPPELITPKLENLSGMDSKGSLPPIPRRRESMVSKGFLNSNLNSNSTKLNISSLLQKSNLQFIEVSDHSIESIMGNTLKKSLFSLSEERSNSIDDEFDSNSRLQTKNPKIYIASKKNPREYPNVYPAEFTTNVQDKFLGKMKQINRIQNRLFQANNHPIQSIEDSRDNSEQDNQFIDQNLVHIKTHESHTIGNHTFSNTLVRPQALMIPKLKGFTSRKNPVLTAIDVPGILEMDMTPENALTKKRIKSVKDDHEKLMPNINLSKKARGKKVNKGPALVAIPDRVVFDFYVPYKTFTKKLTIKNVSSFLQRIRLTFDPPEDYSPYFKYEIISTPLEGEGLLAPGMSCVYLITFLPNSYANENQNLIVKSDHINLTIPIIAALPHFELNLPSVFDCGYCESGFGLTFTHTITNTGGKARFLLMSALDQGTPFELFENLGAGNHSTAKSLTFGVFNIFPSYFSLNTGDSVKMVIQYTPGVLKENLATELTQRRDSQRIRIACDNCETIEIDIVATVQLPKMDLVSPNFEIESGKLPLVDFGNANIDKSKIVEIVMKNPTNLVIPFRWTQTREEKTGDEKINLSSNMFSAKSSFKVLPEIGMLEPLSEKLFKFIFTPEFNKPYKAIATLSSFHNKGKKSIQVLKSFSLGQKSGVEKQQPSSKPLINMSLNGQGTPFSTYLSTYFVFLPPGMQSGQRVTHKIHFTNDSLSKVAYRWEVYGNIKKFLKVNISDADGEIEQGSCRSFKVEFIGNFPAAIRGQLRCYTENGKGDTLLVPFYGTVAVVPGMISFVDDYIDFGLVWLGGKKTVSVPMTNSSKVVMSWKSSICHKNRSLSAFVIVKPSEGIIRPGETISISITFIPIWYQRARMTLQIHILSMWKDDGQQTKHTGARDMEAVLISAIDIVGMVETPKLCVENNKNSLCSFPGVYFSWKLIIRNVRNLAGKFHFKNIETNEFVASFHPSNGSVKPNEFVEVTVKMRAFNVGELNINLTGEVEGMVENEGILNVDVTVTVSDYHYQYHVPENQQAWHEKCVIGSKRRLAQTPANLRLDFGLACPIFVVRTRTIKIRNHSAIPSNFKLTIQHYKPTIDIDDLNFGESSMDKPTGQDEKDKGDKFLSTTQTTKYGFSSKAGQQFIDNITKFRNVLESMKRILSDGRGAAFDAKPTSGTIEAWGEVEIKVTSYNNLVGIYEDTLLCQVGEKLQEFPIRLGVIGIPVKFSGPQLVAHNKNSTNGPYKIDMVNFGSRVINPVWGPSDGVKLRLKSATHHRQSISGMNSNPFVGVGGVQITDMPTKKICIENHSPRQIRLNWVVYVGKLENKLHDEISDLMAICQKENEVDDEEMGILDVYPRSMTIPAFKSATLQCNFRNCMLGNFEAIVLADVIYEDPDGTTRFGPKRVAKAGSLPKQEPVITKDFGSKTIQINDLASVAKLKLTAKCIEPRLALDVGNNIRIKKIINSLVGTSFETIKTVVFLVNESDAVCEFTLDTFPKYTFVVIPSRKHLKMTKSTSQGSLDVFELKQKQQMMITVVLHEDSPFYHTDLTQVQSDENLNSSANESFKVEINRAVSAVRGGRHFSRVSDDRENQSSIQNIRIESSRSLEASDVDINVQSTQLSAVGSLNKNLATGGLYINYANGMAQVIPIVLEQVHE